MSNNVVLRVKDLHTYFYTLEGVVKAVEGVDFSVQKGETFALVGESGCGKSVTALSILQLVQTPPGRIKKGQILFNGEDLLTLDEKKMRQIRGNRISMVFQEPMTSLDPLFPVGYQIEESIRIHMKLTKKEAGDRALEMLKRVAIPDPERRLNDYPHQMSGGMRQRVMIAMALSCNPEILIADEPTTALDVTIQAQILELMNNLKKDFNASVLLITHDLGVVAEMAQAVAVMYTGQIVEYAAVGDILNGPRHPYTIGLMESIPALDEEEMESRMLRAIPGVVPSLLDLSEGCSFQPRCLRAIEICRRERPTFAEVEPNHFVRCWLHG